MNIDFKKFKKIDCDDKCTVLQHPSGHTIKIAHKGLSDSHKKQLDELPMHLAKGGYAKFSQKYDPNMGSKGSKPSQVSNPQAGPTNLVPKPARKAYTEPEDAGPDVVLAALNKKMPPFGPLGAEKPHYPPCINPSCKSFGRSHPNCRCYGGGHEERHFAEGGEVDSYCSSDRPHQEECEYFKAGGIAEGEVAGEAPQESVTPQEPLAVTLKPEEVNPNPEAPVAQPMPASVPQQPQQEAQQIPTPVQQFQKSKENHLNELLQEQQGYESDVNSGHIKPETYHDLFANKSTLGKIGTMFGLLMGGAGAGLTGQPNMLLEMMNKEIQNDLAAQNQSSQNKQSFLKINQANSMNRAQVNAMNQDTQIKSYAQSLTQMNVAAFHKLVSDTAKLPPGPQKAQQEQTLAMMWPAIQQANMGILDKAASAAAFQNTLFGNQNGGESGEQGFQKKTSGMRMMGPQGEKRAEDIESKHVPGIPGQASHPLSGGDRESILAGQEFDKQLNKYIDWAKHHSGDLNPKDMAYGQSLAAGVQGAYRMATHGGVYKEGEQNFISKIIDDHPTKFFNEIRVLPKIQAVSDQHKIRMDQLLKSKGFEGYKNQKPSESEDQIKVVDGVKYKRGPNGEAIKVK